MIDQPDRFADWSADVQRSVADVRRKMKQANDTLRRLRGHAVSPSGAVSVEVDPHGSITQLKLTTQAMRETPDRLAATIIDCCRRAEQDARGTVEAHRKHLTVDTAINDAVSFVREVAGTPEPERRRLSDDEWYTRFRADPFGRNRRA